MVAVFREAWRVLRNDGTLWVNCGDSYNSEAGSWKPTQTGKHGYWQNPNIDRRIDYPGLKPKDLCMMPARLAMELQASGWYLRSEIVWHKPNPMPESVTDRPTKSHEMIYLLTKNGGKPLIWRARDTGEWSYNPDLSEMIHGSKKDLEGGGLSGWDTGPGAHTKLDGRYDSWKGGAFDKGLTDEHQLGRLQSSDARNKDEQVPRWKGFDYFYDADAIREPIADSTNERCYISNYFRNDNERMLNAPEEVRAKGNWRANAYKPKFRNKRSVWTIATQPYSAAHFATFPEDLIRPCIMDR